MLAGVSHASFITRLPLQVHRGDAGPDGLRELPAGLPVRHGSQKQAALHQMASPVLHVHRQEVQHPLSAPP